MAQDKKFNLPVKQKKFAEFFVETGNATDSARRAGYKESSVSEQGYNLKQNPKIQKYIDYLLKQQQRRTQADADKIVEELAMVGFANIQDYYDEKGQIKNIQSLKREASAAIKSIKETRHELQDGQIVKVIREFTLHDKLRALENLGNHFNIFDKDKSTFKDKDLNIQVTIKRKK